MKSERFNKIAKFIQMKAKMIRKIGFEQFGKIIFLIQ